MINVHNEDYLMRQLGQLISMSFLEVLDQEVVIQNYSDIDFVSKSVKDSIFVRETYCIITVSIILLISY